MAKAYDRARTREFVPPCDRDLPKEQQTVFILAWLSSFDVAELEDLYQGAAKGEWPKLIELARFALRGWKNFLMPDGSPAPFEVGPDGHATRETIGRIPVRELLAIVHDVNNSEQLEPPEVGKS